jgi:hypothetical protein
LDVSDEFILTENAYGVFEGPNSYQGWTDWHVFAPTNPRLLVVMRQNILESYAGLLEEIGTILMFLQEQKVSRSALCMKILLEPDLVWSICP